MLLAMVLVLVLLEWSGDDWIPRDVAIRQRPTVTRMLRGKETLLSPRPRHDPTTITTRYVNHSIEATTFPCYYSRMNPWIVLSHYDKYVTHHE